MASFLTRVASTSGNFLGYFDKCHLLKKLLWLGFGQLQEKIGLLYIPLSGHTGHTSLGFFAGIFNLGACRYGLNNASH